MSVSSAYLMKCLLACVLRQSLVFKMYSKGEGQHPVVNQ